MNKRDFIRLLDKYLAGLASREEEEFLLHVYERYQDSQQWDSREMEMINSLEDKMFEKIRLGIRGSGDSVRPADTVAPIPKRARSLPRILIAASVILLIGLGLRFLIKPRHTAAVAARNPVPAKDFSPGGNNAYLVLANGEKLALNQAKIGLLARQGNRAVIKKDDGQIIYANDTAGPPAQGIIVLNKIIVPVGGQYKVVLPDGTDVWLNAASSLEYPVEFSGGKRLVRLTGEAYFQVAKNSAMPFVVNVDDKVDVDVLGTHFDIMAYEDEGTISTTLLQGAVTVADRAHPVNARVLKPGQQAEWSDNAKIEVKTVEAEDAIAWKDGRFLFVNEDIHSIMRKLARWYGIGVEYSSSLKNKSFDGSISRDKNLSEVLKLMELTKSVHFTFGEKKVVVKP
ncbi:MAG TPA: FecR domain-containing protein [Puia sp.]|nr:FecR domain-containing protein [Puia sp.]